MWYIAKALQIIGMSNVLFGLYIGFSQDNLRTELRFAIIGIVIFGIGRLIESKFLKR